MFFFVKGTPRMAVFLWFPFKTAKAWGGPKKEDEPPIYCGVFPVRSEAHLLLSTASGGADGAGVSAGLGRLGLH